MRVCRGFLGVLLFSAAFVLACDEAATLNPRPSKYTLGQYNKVLKEIFDGHPANCTISIGCTLQDADFSGQAFPNGSTFAAANLADTKFNYATLISADLSGANLHRAELRGAVLAGVNLGCRPDGDRRCAELPGADLTGAWFICDDTQCANLRGAKLSGATLVNTKFFSRAVPQRLLDHADLTDADFTGANLTGARFDGAILARAKFDGANLRDANLHESHPGFLPAVREELKRTGHRAQERRVTYEIKRQEQSKLWQAFVNQEDWWGMKPLEYAVLYVLFDLTVEYGNSPWWPLLWLLLLMAPCAGLYALAMLDPRPFRPASIWRVWPADRVRVHHGEDQPQRLITTGFWRTLAWSAYFSLISAFQFGWRDINVGNWLSRIHRKEYILRPTGWVRVVAGIQSLISVYLVALWVLTYFGRPFD